MDLDPPAFTFLLHDVARLLKKRFEQNSRGLTRSQWQVLAYLAENQGINQARLAELIEIEPITLGRIVVRLEALRLIKRDSHPTDRRGWFLHLTPVARGRLERAREYDDVTRREALVGVSEEDRQHLLKTLQALKENLTQACAAPLAGQK
ncbi:MarR family winged helix-turn-helix transcriptional regulator [Bradyrhizobium erythrophlei]|jgi:DNA-binding MarR family transcriptional regulator|uniref:DNA-binding transcriptional regulator, MarR family n=1 Tax=Bradyrhizobium erythrophlei TaxID=1437360 RepID=A0A1M7U6Y2_9BRAD|nr:MarR family transcriptional regulator [Bradyrhizobium erythrophlei]SHN78694.1 DNA-binding transcriptional regulator, MarR family [Bradyrhizobium erythrophlei]